MNDHFSELNHNFYTRYDPQIRSIVARILSQANQARDIDDCVNMVYLELMNRLQQYSETRGTMSAFVTVIARSVSLDYCRSNMRITSELIHTEKIDFLKEPMAFEDKIEFKMLVESIIEKLNKKERPLFTMRYILYYSPDEIAKILKIKRSAVDMRVNRLKGKIKNLLIKGGINI